MTTVGNADLLPVTPIGKLISSIIMMLRFAVLAVPTALVTSEVISIKRFHEDMLTRGESDRLEYKSSAFDSHGKPDVPETVLFEASVLKPVAGFLNGKGGTLIIGVADDGKALGIGPDLELKRWDIDRFKRSS